jgi:hypothetical protein
VHQKTQSFFGLPPAVGHVGNVDAECCVVHRAEIQLPLSILIDQPLHGWSHGASFLAPRLVN